MRKAIAAAATLLALSVAPALAADIGRMPVKAVPPPPPPPVWDVAFGAAIMSDYNFRGISQSDRKPSGTAYAELRYWWLYAGAQAWAVKLPTQPSAEIDFYGGIRPVIGDLTLDFGAMYYYYPGETQLFTDPAAIFTTTSNLGGLGVPFTVTNTDFWEFYGKATYVWDKLVTFSAAAYYTPDWLATNADGLFAVGGIKLAAPENFFGSTGIGAYISGEVGHYWFGDASFFGVPYKLYDYTTWNAGFGFTYKALTLDFRYYDTDLTKGECYVNTTDPQGLNNGTLQSKWCGEAFIVKASFDTTFNALK